MAQRHWVFTVNNYTYIPEVLPVHGVYAIIGKEGASTDTPHLQGYVECTKTCRFSAIQKWLHSKAHCEKRRGTREQARDYCKKEGDFIEIGVWPATGQGNLCVYR